MRGVGTLRMLFNKELKNIALWLFHHVINIISNKDKQLNHDYYDANRPLWGGCLLFQTKTNNESYDYFDANRPLGEAVYIV